MKKTKPKSSQSQGKGKYQKKITDERKPFIFERVAAGVPGTVIAEEFGEEYDLSIDQSSVNEFLRLHPEEYKEWRDRNFKDDVRLADRKARLAALQRKADLLGNRIDKMLSTEPGKQLSPAELNESPIMSMLPEYRRYIDQIRDESGDKPVGGKDGDGKGGTTIHIYNSVPGVLTNVRTDGIEAPASRLGSDN